MSQTALTVSITAVALALAASIYCFFALFLGRLAAELKVQKRWYAWVPVLNVFLACRIAGKGVFWTVLLFIPVVNIVVYVFLCLRFAKTCGRGRFYGVLLVLPGLNLFAAWHLAFGGKPLVAEGV